jgi:hypothetical protein
LGEITKYIKSQLDPVERSKTKKKLVDENKKELKVLEDLKAD